MKKGIRVITTAVVSAALIGAFALSGCSSEQHEAVTLQVYAANSLSSAMDEACAAYTESHDWVTFADGQYESSGNLVEKLAAGGQADVFFSASESKMDDAESNGSIISDTRVDMFNNDLVVVVQEGSDITIDSLQDIIDNNYTLAVGDDSVPAGNYAAQSFYQIGAYSDESGKGGEYIGITPTTASKVGDVAEYVSSGNVQVGIVFLSDTYRYDGLQVAYTIPSDMHDSIIYPAAVCTSTTNQEEAQAFLDWCKTDSTAEEIWQKWGLSMAE